MLGANERSQHKPQPRWGRRQSTSGSHQQATRLLGHHDLDELLVVDLAVTVNVRLADHLIDLLVRQLLAKVGHDVAQLSSGNEAVAVLVEDTKASLSSSSESVSFI